MVILLCSRFYLGAYEYNAFTRYYDIGAMSEVLMLWRDPVCMGCISWPVELSMFVRSARVLLDTHTVFVVWVCAAWLVVVLFGVLSALLVPFVHTMRKVRK